MKAEFINLIENVGWDTGIEYIETKIKQLTDETKIKRLTDLIDTYWSGYLLAIDDDVDGGECFETRQKAITDILEELV